MDSTDKALFAVLGCIGLLLAFIMGWEAGKNNVRKEALLLNHAQYVADTDGTAKFTWKK